jgi:hypothetical protein
MNGRCWLALLAGVVAAAAPVRADEPAKLTRRERGDLAIQARAILRHYCKECHGEAPVRDAVSVLDHAGLTAKGPPVPFVNLDDPRGRSQVIELIEDGSMPPGGRDRPTTDELAVLKRWVAQAAPSYPKAFDDTATLDVMIADFDRQKAEDRPFLRYLSLAHLVPDDSLQPPTLAGVEFRLQQSLRAATTEARPVPPPVPVDDTATLFRLDIRALGWDSRGLFVRVVENSTRPDEYTMTPFDLILLEYPHGFALAPKDPRAGGLGRFLAATRQLRPVPFLRADWLADTLRNNAINPPVNRPLAEELKGLVALAEAKAKDPKARPCGVRSRPFFEMKPLEVPAVADRVALPPFSAWYGGSLTPDPNGLKFEAVLPLKGNKVASEVELGERFKFRVSADRDLRLLLLNVMATGDVRVIPIADGDVLPRSTPQDDRSRLLRPDTEQLGFVNTSLLSGAVETEHWVLVAAPEEVPPPTVVRSIHHDGPDCRMMKVAPVWRFIFDAPVERFDPNRASRKVLSQNATE